MQDIKQQEFMEKFDYLNNDYGADLQPIWEYLKSEISLAVEKEKERVVSIIKEEFRSELNQQ